MKGSYLPGSFFLCIAIGLTAPLSPGNGDGVIARVAGFHEQKAEAGFAVTIPQSRKPLISATFGSPGQVYAGVNIHFVTGHEQDLDRIAAAGFKLVRMDFEWQETEPSKGTYNWSGYDELTSNLVRRNLGAIYILDYSHSLYEETVESIDPVTGKEQQDLASPQRPESIAAFARWAAAAARHFKGKNIIWEIWNEPNISFWKPKPDVSKYNALALASTRAIKAEVPEALVIGPASSEVPMPFLESFLSSGILEYLDAVSIHPYRNYAKSPETASADYKELRKLIDRYAPAGKKDIPIISSEWGYSSFTKGISAETQAGYIVRMQLSNLLNGIPVSIWYDWKNDGNNLAEREENFGTVTIDLKPKQAYTAIQVMSHELDGFTFSGRISLENENDYLLTFQNKAGDYTICAWTVDPEHPVTMNKDIPNMSHAAARDGYGQSFNMKTEMGKLVLDLKPLPQYIKLPRGTELK